MLPSSSSLGQPQARRCRRMQAASSAARVKGSLGLGAVGLRRKLAPLLLTSCCACGLPPRGMKPEKDSRRNLPMSLGA